MYMNGPPQMNVKMGNNASSTQQKFFSKSPNQNSKLMTSTNYGKFKAIPTTQVTQPYPRGNGTQTASGQYLPKLQHPMQVAGQSQLSNYHGQE
jgi:hypothetical protein